MRNVRFAVTVVALLSGVFVASGNATVLSPSSYAYPMPGKAGDAPVLCTTCVSTTKNLPTWPYSLPIKRFVGRMLDSARTREIQAPIRTLRARDARVVPGNGRLYVMFGGSRFATWNLNTFFTSDLGRPLTQLSPSYNDTPELYLPYPAYVDADTDGAWRTITVDGQNRLGGFDWDDRGYVYLAYGPYGWGIVQDTGSAFNFISQVTDKGNLVPTNNMQVLRSGSNYYGVIMNPTGSSQSAIFDVTNAVNPSFIGYVDKAPYYFEKIAADKNQGAQEDFFGTIAAGSQVVEIYTASQFVNNRAPSKTITPAYGLYWDITTDGTNFYAIRGIGANQDLEIISPSTPGDATSYAVTKTYHIPGGSNAGELRWGGGYLTLSARDSQNVFDIRLFKINNGDFKEIDLAKFFQKYYTAPPSGYAKPDGNTSAFYASFVYSTGGRDYLIFEAYGMADVYELQAGDTVDIAVNTASGYGTRNPNSTTNDQGPYYGDPVSFSSIASTLTPMTLNWDFGNPESLDNTATLQSGTPAVHKFAGLTTASQINSSHTVTATSATDSTISDTQPVTLLVPSARVGIGGTSFLFMQPNASATAMVPGDTFVDASDGSVESHYGIWTIDATTAKGTPLESQLVGVCGAHTMSFEAHYVPYTGTGATVTPVSVAPYVSSVSNVSYTVQPVIAGVAVSTYDATTVTFKNTGRAGAAATFATGAAWSEDLTFLDGVGAVIPNTEVTKSSLVGTQDTFVVTKSTIATAKKAVLTITLDPLVIADTTCAGMVTSSAQLPIALPDPSITVSGCGNVGSPCTLTAASLSNASQSGWTYQWKLNTALTGTAAVYSPIISAAGSYTIDLTATNAFGAVAATSKILSVQAPLCTGKPSNLSFSVSCSTCTTSSVIKFTPFAFSPYAFQDCDSFAWSFGDGGSSTVKTPTHQYTKDGLYTVKLTVTNSNGSDFVSSSVQIGNVTPPPPPPPPCPTSAPSNIFFNLQAASGCTAASPNCKSSETITFTPAPWGYSLQTCDEYQWSFGDGGVSSSKNASHVYANPGTYPVTLTVFNDKGSSTSPAINVVITQGGGSCAGAPGQFMDMTYSGATSGCTTAGTTPCAANETITFNASSFGYVFQACDTFAWNFGDGTAAGTGKSVTHKFASNGTYTVKLTVTNTNGSSTGQRDVNVGVGGTPPTAADFTFTPAAPSINVAVSFAGVVGSGSVSTWSWNFGDNSTGVGQSVSHTYTNPGTYNVTLTASNGSGSAVKSRSVTVTSPNSYAFLLPVVTHLDNADGTKWQTDLQFFNPTPNFDPTSPMTLSFEFKGQTKTLVFDKSTDVRKDFLNYLTTEKTSGSVIVRGNSQYPPQMWTRTYIVSATGVGTYGQLIPAIALTTQQAATSAVPKQYIPGLHFGPKESVSKFRTNIGLVNSSAAVMDVTMLFLDKEGFQVGSPFNTTVQPFTLVQVNDGAIRSAVPQLDPSKVYTVELSTSTAAGLVAYASIVDNTSNDPIYVQAVSEIEAAAAPRKVQILPGLSHFNTPAGDSWRSDVTVFNADGRSIQFDMELLGNDGTKVAEAKNIGLGGSQAMQLDDMLTLGTPLPAPAGAQSGTLRITTNNGTEYPIIYSRTYNDRATAGTFGQGIPAFSGTEGNVKVGKPAYIAGVRSNLGYYTNLGLVSASTEASIVSVKMLEPLRGQVIGERTYTVNPGQTLIDGSANSDFLHALAPSMDEQGTLKIEVTSGGNVWAFASIIDKMTKDPEYVPAFTGN